MKSNSNGSLASRLSRLRTDFERITNPAAKASLIKDVEELIVCLEKFRVAISDPALASLTEGVPHHIGEILRFLELAKSNDALSAIVSLTEKTSHREKRKPVVINESLTNAEIRKLLQENLSRDELAAIAKQRSISTGKGTVEELRRSIQRNLDRQEGYERLAAS